LREEAEYLAQFGELPTSPEGLSEGESAVEASSANVPVAVIPEASATDQMEQRYSDGAETAAPKDGGNAPAMNAEPQSDLESIREELRKRNEESAN
jgi:hypothetical protein